jgi:DNA processing protein
VNPPSINRELVELRLGTPVYPARLSALAGAPDPLWMRGSYRPAHRAVAIVGARRAHRRFYEAARELAAQLAKEAVDILSGGAIGIDTAAHLGALDRSGVTCAVLGTGLDVAYPAQNASLFGRIVANGGALFSQFPLGSRPVKRAFPKRNVVLAGLADAVVVIEAGATSGSLYTAQAAIDLRRPVIALTGSPGADALIARGRALGARDVSELLARVLERPFVRETAELSLSAARLLSALDRTPRELGELAILSQLPMLTCASLAAELELTGLCARASGGRYLRT